MAHLEFQNVEVHLPGGRHLFTFPRLEIPSGQHLLVKGESGRGKTTFLHLLAGLFSPQKGRVLFEGKNLAELSDSARCDLRRAQIGVIFQKLNLLETLTVEENISLSASQSVEDSIARALQRVNLQGRQKDLCSVLSLGEQQRVAVARVLAQAPRVILADEPTSSLDDKNTRFVMEALKEAASGKTWITVSHDQRISSYFDRVLSFEEFCS